MTSKKPFSLRLVALLIAQAVIVSDLAWAVPPQTLRVQSARDNDQAAGLEERLTADSPAEIQFSRPSVGTGPGQIWNLDELEKHFKKEGRKDGLKGKVIFVGIDFNVPTTFGDEILDENAQRIRAAKPTIEWLANKGAKVVLISHLGRPDGKTAPDAEDKGSGRVEHGTLHRFSFRRSGVDRYLGKLLGKPVKMFYDTVNRTNGGKVITSPKEDSAAFETQMRYLSDIWWETFEVVRGMRDGDVALLENIRFHPEEQAKDLAEKQMFAEGLLHLADAFVQDGFGKVHRADASVIAVNLAKPKGRELPKAAGFLVEKEIAGLSGLLDAIEDPKRRRPLFMLLGGGKASDKIPLIRMLAGLLKKIDSIGLGGRLAFPFLKVHEKMGGGSINVGGSLKGIEGEVEVAQQLLESLGALAQTDRETGHRIFLLPSGARIFLPKDFRAVAADWNRQRVPEVKNVSSLQEGQQGADIGEETQKSWKKKIEEAGVFFWNGPQGIFETEELAQGSYAVALAAAKATRRRWKLSGGTRTFLGGGDTATVVETMKKLGKLDPDEDFTHVSTGGGAAVEFLEKNGWLPGTNAARQEGSFDVRPEVRRGLRSVFQDRFRSAGQEVRRVVLDMDPANFPKMPRESSLLSLETQVNRQLAAYLAAIVGDPSTILLGIYGVTHLPAFAHYLRAQMARLIPAGETRITYDTERHEWISINGVRIPVHSERVDWVSKLEARKRGDGRKRGREAFEEDCNKGGVQALLVADDQAYVYKLTRDDPARKEATEAFSKRQRDRLNSVRELVPRILVLSPEEDPSHGDPVVLGVNEERALYGTDGKPRQILYRASPASCACSIADKVLNAAFGVSNWGGITWSRSKTIPGKEKVDLSRMVDVAGATWRITSIFSKEEWKRQNRPPSGQVIEDNAEGADLVTVSIQLKRSDITHGEVMEAFRQAAEGPLKGVLRLADRTEYPVSLGFVNESSAVVVDPRSVVVEGEGMVRIQMWVSHWGHAQALKAEIQRMTEELPMAQAASSRGASIYAARPIPASRWPQVKKSDSLKGKPLRVAINGAGRGGKTLLRSLWDDPDFTVAAVNEEMDLPSFLVEISRADQVHGEYPFYAKRSAPQEGDIAGIPYVEVWDRYQKSPRPRWRFPYFQETSSLGLLASQLERIGVDQFIEATGLAGHLTRQGMREVTQRRIRPLFTALPRDRKVPVWVRGVNDAKPLEEQIRANRMEPLSLASDVSSAVVPVAAALTQEFGIQAATSEVAHGLRMSQGKLFGRKGPDDADPTDVLTLLPSEIGGVTSGLVPPTHGLIQGVEVRTASTSPNLCQLTWKPGREGITAQEVNEKLKRLAATGALAGLFDASEEPIEGVVSSREYLRKQVSGTVLLSKTSVEGGFIKVWIWFGYEWSYLQRVKELMRRVGELDRHYYTAAAEAQEDPKEAQPIEIAAKWAAVSPGSGRKLDGNEVLPLEDYAKAGADVVMVGHPKTRQPLHPQGDSPADVQTLSRLAGRLDLKRVILTVADEKAPRPRQDPERQKALAAAKESVRQQVRSSLLDLPVELLSRWVVAYQPPGKADPDWIQAIHQVIRWEVERMFGREASSRLRVIYGGEVTPQEARAILSQPDVDGFLLEEKSSDLAWVMPILQAEKDLGQKKYESAGRLLYLLTNWDADLPEAEAKAYLHAVRKEELHYVQVGIAPSLRTQTLSREETEGAELVSVPIQIAQMADWAVEPHPRASPPTQEEPPPREEEIHRLAALWQGSRGTPDAPPWPVKTALNLDLRSFVGNWRKTLEGQANRMVAAYLCSLVGDSSQDLAAIFGVRDLPTLVWYLRRKMALLVPTPVSVEYDQERHRWIKINGKEIPVFPHLASIPWAVKSTSSPETSYHCFTFNP